MVTGLLNSTILGLVCSSRRLTNGRSHETIHVFTNVKTNIKKAPHFHAPQIGVLIIWEEGIVKKHCSEKLAVTANKLIEM